MTMSRTTRRHLYVHHPESGVVMLYLAYPSFCNRVFLKSIGPGGVHGRLEQNWVKCMQGLCMERVMHARCMFREIYSPVV